MRQVVVFPGAYGNQLEFGNSFKQLTLINESIVKQPLVEHFKFFSKEIGEKCPLFFTLFLTENVSEKVIMFSPLFFVFKVKNLKQAKKCLKFSKFFTCFFSAKKSLKNNGHFSPIFSLKNLKCSTSEPTDQQG
jgi:hypothetical protein